MRLSSTPAIYDFQNRKMQSAASQGPRIVTHGVTWRNVKLMLTNHDQMCLTIDASDVVLESVSIVGAYHGVHVLPGGSLTMRSCRVDTCSSGICLEGDSTLLATNLKVSNCGMSAFSLSGSARATVTDCRISGSKLDGVFMRDGSSMVGTRIWFIDVKYNMVFVRDQARLSLTGCVMTESPKGKGRSWVTKPQWCWRVVCLMGRCYSASMWRVPSAYRSCPEVWVGIRCASTSSY